MSFIGGFGKFSNYNSFSQYIGAQKNNIKNLNQFNANLNSMGNDEVEFSNKTEMSEVDTETLKSYFTEMMSAMQKFFSMLFSFFSNFNFGQQQEQQQKPVESGDNDYKTNNLSEKEKFKLEAKKSKQQVYDTKVTSQNAGEIKAEKANIANDEKVKSYPTKAEMEAQANSVAQKVIKASQEAKRSEQQVYDTKVTRENAGELKAEKANIEAEKKKKS